MSRNDSSFSVHVWRRVEGEERLLGAQPPTGSPEWMAAAHGLIKPQVAYGASRAEALGGVVLALATARQGHAPALRIAESRLLLDASERPAGDAEVVEMLGLLAHG